MPLFEIFIAILASTLVGWNSFAGEVNVAVASNFTAPMNKLSIKFQEKTGHKLLISYGATGKFYAQIKNGAPFEVFLSADQEHPKKLVQEKLAASETQFTYAIGKLVLWSNNPKLIDVNGDILTTENFKHLSIANPILAPYGAAAQEVLKKRGLWEKLQSRLVLGESITQAYQFVATGNAELGFLAYAQIKKDNLKPDGSYWLVPQAMYSPLKQDAILLEAGKKNMVATEFLQFLKSDIAKKIILEYGYNHGS